MKTPLDQFFNERSDQRTLDILTRGPLSPQVMVYAQRLHDEGYAIQSGQLQLRLLADFSKWLKSKGIGTTDVDSTIVERYAESRLEAGKLRKGDRAALTRMLRLLRPGQTGAPLSDLTPIEIALERYQFYLRQERGLCETTVTHYTPTVRSFLVKRFPSGVPEFDQITASDIAEFVQRQAERVTTKHAATVVTALRSFLRHLLHIGAIGANLAGCVPTIATWAQSHLPKHLPADQIQRVLDVCDRNTAPGRRDYAILLLLARLGLRAGEVVALTLDDIDWEAGVLTIRGKGRRVSQMPAPFDVGAALADYIHRDRPLCSTRRVFIRKESAHDGLCQLDCD